MGKWENSSGLHTVYIRPLYSLQTATIRPIHGLNKAIYGQHKAVIRLTNGHYTVITQHGNLYLERYLPYISTNSRHHLANIYGHCTACI